MTEEYKYKAIDLKIPWGRQKKMAVWSEINAKVVARKLRPLIGQNVYVHGGGGLLGEYWIGKLLGVKVGKVFYYAEPPKGIKKEIKDGSSGYYSPKDYFVEAKLKFRSKKESPGYDAIFTPHLGSWRIKKLVPYKKPTKRGLRQDIRIKAKRKRRPDQPHNVGDLPGKRI